jgi:hypothetical protein
VFTVFTQRLILREANCVLDITPPGKSDMEETLLTFHWPKPVIWLCLTSKETLNIYGIFVMNTNGAYRTSAYSC